jgi:hypothetical protein
MVHAFLTPQGIIYTCTRCPFTQRVASVARRGNLASGATRISRLSSTVTCQRARKTYFHSLALPCLINRMCSALTRVATFWHGNTCMVIGGGIETNCTSRELPKNAHQYVALPNMLLPAPCKLILVHVSALAVFGAMPFTSCCEAAHQRAV